MTLSEKEAQLHDTVAMPTAADWQLSCDDPAEAELVISKANAVLVDVLERCKSQDIRRLETWGSIAKAAFGGLEGLEKEYPGAGLLDGEGFETVARFFAVNFRPAMYHYLRYV